MSPVQPPQLRQFVRSWDFKDTSPYGLAVSSTGEVFVAGEDRRIQVFRLDGSFVREWGSYGEGEGQFKGPCGVAEVNGEVFVCDTFCFRIQVFTTQGKFIRKWGSPGIK